MTKDLRQYLNTRFLKGSADHDLQNTIRDNLYLRTVPCTTRPKREGEVDGVDYTFLSLEEFLTLERSGNLLESGIYEGNHYGTPKPPRESPLHCPLVRNITNGTPLHPQVHSVLPGAHPSSEGKRRRNRSNVEAMASKSVDPDISLDPSLSGIALSSNSYNDHDVKDPNFKDDPGTPTELGPLSANWEKAYTENGEPYFIDHATGTSQWLDPRLARVQKKAIEDCADDELPYGWEKIDDPQFGTYYIDHINRQTQYENPVLQYKRVKQPNQMSHSTVHNGNGVLNVDGSFDGTNAIARRGLSANQRNEKSQNGEASGYPLKAPTQSDSSEILKFTRNPAELRGSFITSTLVKSSRGFGFTIVGGDDEEFLQIKSVVPDGPAWQEGKLAQGDVLVYVDDVCVLGYTHSDVVTMFQNIPVGDEVTLEVCRGYPLPFDPNDPNTEIVTTVAVTASDTSATNSHRPPPLPLMPTGSFVDEGAEKERRPLDNENAVGKGSNGAYTVDGQSAPDILDFYNRAHDMPGHPDVLTVGIVKGLLGFGFTIADSANGQKVKKILDTRRCKNLAEGDVLLEINGRDVRGLEHAHVVQFLKDCTQGLEATIKVQRGGQSSPSKNRAKMLKTVKSVDENLAPRKNEFGRSQEHRLFNSEFSKSIDGGVAPSGPYRSKTPTADLYSNHREKEVVPNRPKTPLVDTRNRPKTPTSVSNLGSANNVKAPAGVQDDFVDNRATGNSSAIPLEEGDGHGGAALGPGSLYGKDVRYPESGEVWHSGRQSRGYDEEPVSVERGRVPPIDNFDECGNSTSANPYPEWPAESKQQKESYYGYEYSRGDGEGTAAILPGNKGMTDQELRMSQRLEDPSGYNTYGSSNPYGATYGRNTSVPSANHYGISTNNNFSTYNSNSSGSFSVGGNQYETEFGNHYPSVPLRKQGTSFEREQPSPVTHVGRNCNSWYGSHQERSQSFSPSYGTSRTPEIIETTITLYKQETGFGFRIIGGTEEGSQVSIGHIVPGGAADLDGRLRSGDEIVSVDNQSVLHTSHHHVVQLMGQAAQNGRVILGIRRRLQQKDGGRGKSLDGLYPYDVTVVRRENEGFGFVIISSVTRAGSTIGRIIENSPAERCGCLHVGDRILAVNGKDIMNLHHGEIVNLIKDSGFTVTLTIGAPLDDSSSTTSASQKTSNNMVVNAMAMPVVGELSEVHMRRNLCGSTPCLPVGYHDSSYGSRRTSSSYGSTGEGGGGGGIGGGYATKPSFHRSSCYSAHDALGNCYDTWQQEEGNLEDEQYYAVELLRGTRGFGFSIRGGKEFQNMPLFVLRIAEDGPAARDGRLRMGDQIVEINGINTKDVTHAEAIELIKQGGSSVRLLIKRGTNKIPPPYGSHSTLPLGHQGPGAGNGGNQSQVTSPVLAGNLAPGGQLGYLPTNAIGSSSHLSPALHNGPLGQSSPRVVMPLDRDPYYSHWEYERGPV